VDDHPIMRIGYQFLISQEMDMEICGEAGTALEALEKIPESRPDLVIVDISLGGMNGLELIKRLQGQYADLAVLVVTTHDESLYGERAIMAGTRGYVMKREVDLTVIAAIRSIMRGGFYLSEQLSTKILLQYHRMKEEPEAAEPIQMLSDRELEIFELMGQGLTTKQIAKSLVISVKTVESHRGRIKEKLAVETTAQLLQHATLWVDRQV
jgi:DNA-binding NarL/FixJ family response regulator